MRLLPLQIDMYVLAGEWYPFWGPDAPLANRLLEARQSLMERTGCDFGYDLERWHDHLVENEKDGYCWSNKHRSIAVVIRRAMADAQWQEAVAALKNDGAGGPPAV
jgi:hypothetical protein